MRSIKQVGIVGLTLVSLAAPATAQGVTIGRDGVTLQDPRDTGRARTERSTRGEVSEREAVRIARGQGLRDVDNVRSTRGSYRVEGTDRRGRDIDVVVDRRSGDVLSVK
ncbi:PepSY domain-containing protein [Aureimonas leprariae]|uniref:PepSY domain-containing protein n=1 Tax=Plantimonas leprariae TaxID=2615207 RepID=A0A7V7PSE7_9HYPH|nr:PepSY domain-containing protein [Aureimonas leprariae]KAB0682064.1 PepSY domain-containing protein [Aureimonas leprariae]